MLLHKFQHHRQRLQTPERCRQVNSQPAPRLGIFRLHGQLGLFQFGQHPGTGPIERGPGIGQRQTPGGAIEQAHLQPALQSGDAFADGRRAQVQALGSSFEAAGFGHADKHIDALQALGSKHTRLVFVN